MPGMCIFISKHSMHTLCQRGWLCSGHILNIHVIKYIHISDILCRRYVHTIWFDAWQPPGGTLEKNKVLKRSTMAPTRSHWLSLQWWRWFFVSLRIATNAPIKAFRAASVWCAGALLTTGTSYYQIHPRFVRSQTALHQGDCHRIKPTLFITRTLFSLWSTPAAQARGPIHQDFVIAPTRRLIMIARPSFCTSAPLFRRNWPSEQGYIHFFHINFSSRHFLGISRTLTFLTLRNVDLAVERSWLLDPP